MVGANVRMHRSSRVLPEVIASGYPASEGGAELIRASEVLSLCKIISDGITHQLCYGMKIELSQNIAAMCPHSFYAQSEFVGHFLTTFAFCLEAEQSLFHARLAPIRPPVDAFPKYR